MYFFRKQPSKLVAIVVPLSNRPELTPEEEISLKHLLHFLGRYDKYIVINKNLSINFPNFRVKRFDCKYFGSAEAHKKLILSPEFYKSFLDYKYILIYHLDSLVFSDQLEQWCELDYDFIGAPWIKHRDTPYFGKPAFENKVGNAGFALQKIESYLKVFYSPRYHIDPSQYWTQNYASKSKWVQYVNLPKKYLKRLRFFNNARREISRYNGNFELFWANRAPYYYPNFKIAPVEIALRFAFECVPRYCFELNDYTLPFGCHAWQRYDKDFWEPYLLK